MYVSSTFGDREFTAISVAPPAFADLHPCLKKLSVAHFMIHRGESFKEVIDALSAVSDEQIEKSRLQFLHLNQEIKDYFKAISFDVLKDAMTRESWQDIFSTMSQDALEQAKSSINQLENAPKSKKLADKLVHTLDFCSQCAIILQQYALQGTTLVEQQEQLLADYETVAQKFSTMQQALSAYYPEVKQNLPTLENIKQQAQQSLAKQLDNVHEIDFHKLWRIDCMLGSRDVLWRVVQNRSEDKQLIASVHHQELLPEENAQVRQQMLATLQAYDSFNTTGVINNLALYMAALNYERYNYARKSDGVNAEVEFNRQQEAQEEVRQRCLYSPPEKKQWTPQERQQEIEKIRENKIFSDKFATGIARLCSDIKQGVEEIASTFGIQAQQQNTLTLTTGDNGVVVGKFSHKADLVMLVYPDPENYEISENAVYMVLLKSEEMKGGIPALTDDFRANKMKSASNFHSYNAFLREMADPSLQEYFLKETFAVSDQTFIEGVETVLKKKGLQRGK